MKIGDTTKSRIVEAASDILSRRGSTGIRTREIAREAGVNTAAVNYHFGSKDELVRRVLDSSLQKMLSDWRIILDLDGMNMQVKLYCLLDYTMENVIRSPGILNSHLFDPQLKLELREPFSRKVGDFLRELSETLAQHMPQSAADLRLGLGQALVTSISSALIPQLFETIADGKISTDSARSRFLISLLKNSLGIYLSPSDIVQSDIARTRNLQLGPAGVQA